MNGPPVAGIWKHDVKVVIFLFDIDVAAEIYGIVADIELHVVIAKQAVPQNETAPFQFEVALVAEDHIRKAHRLKPQVVDPYGPDDLDILLRAAGKGYEHLFAVKIAHAAKARLIGKNGVEVQQELAAHLLGDPDLVENLHGLGRGE